MFKRRDAAVHFKEDFHEPVAHPAGTHTAESNVTYSLEAAATAVDLLLEVLTTCVEAPREKLPDLVAWAADMRSKVEGLTSTRDSKVPDA